MQVIEGSVQNLGFQVPEVAVFDVDRVPETHQEWSENIENLDLTEILGDLAVSTGDLVHHEEISYTMARDPDPDPAKRKTRDWWAPDHLWHFDGTRNKVQPVFTVIGCLHAAEGSPPTDVLDSKRLLEITLEGDFWERHDIDKDDLPDIASVFLDSTYQREAQPYLRDAMNSDEREALDATVQADLKKEGVKTVDELLKVLDERYRAKQFPLIRQTPLSNLDTIFIDGGVRNSKLVGPEGEDLTEALHALRREYLAGDRPKELGLVRTVGWVANRCVIFPQVGTLHRANPGNDHRRALHIGVLREPDSVPS